MKKYSLQVSDIHLILNLVNSTESFKTAESWTPICLPMFDSRYNILNNQSTVQNNIVIFPQWFYARSHIIPG